MSTPDYKKCRRPFWIAFSALSAIYVLALALMFSLPHRLNSTGFGRLNAFQAFAGLGDIASLGLLDFRLTDWYYAPIEGYDRHVLRAVAILTPLFLFWAALLAVGAQSITRRRKNEYSQ